jgi:hypothetical protein
MQWKGHDKEREEGKEKAAYVVVNFGVDGGMVLSSSNDNLHTITPQNIPSDIIALSKIMKMARNKIAEATSPRTRT